MRVNGSDLEFEPFKPGPTERLPAVYAELRDRFPVYRSSSSIWVISRFDDVKAVQSNPGVFSSRPNPYEGVSAPQDVEMKPGRCSTDGNGLIWRGCSSVLHFGHRPPPWEQGLSSPVWVSQRQFYRSTRLSQ